VTSRAQIPRRFTVGLVVPEPPDDPETWTDEEWLAWLEEVDEDAPPEPDGHPARPRRSTPSALLGAAMLGLHRAIYGGEEGEVEVVIEAGGDPEEPERLEVRLDPDDPDASTVTVRPWIEDDAGGDGRQAP
jgi:hypothetical protein